MIFRGKNRSRRLSLVKTGIPDHRLYVVTVLFFLAVLITLYVRSKVSFEIPDNESNPYPPPARGVWGGWGGWRREGETLDRAKGARR